MELKGYAELKADANSTFCVGPLAEYRGQVLRVMDWGVDGSAMVLNMNGNALGDFPPEAIHRSFRCKEYGHVLLPPDMGLVEQMVYVTRCLGRKGGYDQRVRWMVIGASLQKGRFEDGLLWAVENEERARATFGS